MSDWWSDDRVGSDCAKQICLSSRCKFVIERSLLCMVLPVWIAFHNCTLRWQCEMHRSQGHPPPHAFCSNLLTSYWNCFCCLAGESVCVAKSQCEWPLCPRPGRSCHLCNGNHISAPLFMLPFSPSLCLAPLLFLSLASSYCIIGIIKPQCVEEDIRIYPFPPFFCSPAQFTL